MESNITHFDFDEFGTNGRTLVCQFVKDCGLGNMLFEAAAAYGIAKRLGMRLEFSWQRTPKRDFDLAAFGFATPPYRKEVPVVSRRLGQGNRKIVEASVRAIAQSKEKVVAICNPYQAEECFADVADEIRELYRLEPFDLPNPPGTTPVAVQVRRGDYVNHARLDVVTPDYFFGAMDWMREQIPDAHFIVVSDDPRYCELMLRTQLDVTVMPPQNSIDGLRTIASCKAAIISNSTFGWWGAWLSGAELVCVPEIWHHGAGSYGEWEPAPARWKRISIGKRMLPPPLEPTKVMTVIEQPPPDLDRAIVYPWHADQAQWEELRYSLRSIEKFFTDKECPIFILGTRRPGWLIEHPRVRYIGAWSYREALMKGTQIADKVLWMNDDILLLRNIGWKECAAPRYLREVGPDFLEKAETQSNPWRENCLRILKKLREMGITDQKVYSTHTPYVYEREKSLKVFEEFGVTEKMPFELAMFHLFPEGSRPIGEDRTQEVPFGNARFLNVADRHLTAPMKEAVKALLPEYAPWELRIPFKS